MAIPHLNKKQFHYPRIKTSDILKKYPLAEKYGVFTYNYQYELTNNAINRYNRYVKATSKDVLLASANKGLRYNALATPKGRTGNLIRTAYAKIVTNEDGKVTVELAWPANKTMEQYSLEKSINPLTHKTSMRAYHQVQSFYYAFIQNKSTSFHHTQGGPGFMQKAAERTRKFFMAELRKRLS